MTENQPTNWEDKTVTVEECEAWLRDFFDDDTLASVVHICCPQITLDDALGIVRNNQSIIELFKSIGDCQYCEDHLRRISSPKGWESI